jgi:hypothetical protein
MRIPAIVLLLSCTLINAATTISGELLDSKLDPAGATYVVEKDLVVPAGRKVTVPQGTVFLFKQFVGVRIDGEMVIAGSAAKQVVFTSINDTAYAPATGQLANPFDWNGVLVAPDAKGLTAANLRLTYSVYGIKSQSPNLRLSDAVFAQNGQFHVVVNDAVQPVQDNLPFSYGSPVVDANRRISDGPGQPGQASAAPPLAPLPQAASSHSRKGFRIVCLGAAVAAAGVGTFFQVRAGQYRDERDSYHKDTSLDPTVGSEKWQAAEDSRQGNEAGAVASFGVGAALLIGFGVSFAF